MAVISVSRRTDIPAFYSSWFNRLLTQGFCHIKNPYNGTLREVKLNRSSVDAFVFWSKNFIPFMESLNDLDRAGYPYYLNYTINSYPAEIEPLGIPPSILIENLKTLSSKTPVIWRYDPVYLSPAMSFDYHLKNFRSLCGIFAGKAVRVVLNTLQEYGKVMKRIRDARIDPDFRYSASDEQMLELILKLAGIADEYGIPVSSCTQKLNKTKILPVSHCIDRNILETITGQSFPLKIRPAYPGCHCYESIDIGIYNTCPHRCIYCYANNQHDQVDRLEV
jgi:hypothetical protein